MMTGINKYTDNELLVEIEKRKEKKHFKIKNNITYKGDYIGTITTTNPVNTVNRLISQSIGGIIKNDIGKIVMKINGHYRIESQSQYDLRIKANRTIGQ